MASIERVFATLDPPAVESAPEPAHLAHLTAAQRHAATHAGGNLLIVAGAGTGKTTTLTARLAHLVEKGVDPSRILLLTFSRRAAAELVSRVDGVVGAGVARSVWRGTFHAVANRLLRRHGTHLGLDPSFTVLDQSDTADLLALVRDELRAAAGAPPDRDGAATRGRRTAKPSTMAEVLSCCTNGREPLSDVLARRFPWIIEDREELKASFVAYTLRKRSRHLLDYDDLLLSWAALLDVAGVAGRLQGQFDHILVDEVQDTNALQADILEGMAAGGAVVTAVGDDAQSIYAFRAATVRNILDFPQRFDAEIALLERSHRSTPQLLAFTNAVIAEASERHEKTLDSLRPPGRRPEVITCADEAAQSGAVCERVLDHFACGTPLRAQAVLVRTGHHSDLLELELSARNIPFRKFGGLSFLEAAHVKDLLAACRLIENRRDELAWFRVLQLLDGVGPATARRIGTALADDAAIGAVPGPVAAEVAVLVAMLVAARGPNAAGRPGVQVEAARMWLDPHIARTYRKGAPARRTDLEIIARAAAAAPSLEAFLVDLTLDPPKSTGDLAGPPHLDDDYLTISTIHSAKGLEWDVVHAIHLADGNVPSDLATGSVAEVEEERRLLYVGLTRARDALHCYIPLRYHHHKHARDDAHGYAQPTRFFTAAVLAHADDAVAPVGWGRGVDVAECVATSQVRPLASVDAQLAALWD